MSIICYYFRTTQAALGVLSEDPEAIFGDLTDLPPGSEVIDIDRAYDGLGWLVSPLRRAEAAHAIRLIREPDWPNAEARASVARLNAMVVDDALTAIEGRSEERFDAIDLGLGGAALFEPDVVRRLSLVLAGIDEATLRERADFRAMDEDDVMPGNWQEEGEDIFETYLVPALERLKAFYAAAAESGQIVLVMWS